MIKLIAVGAVLCSLTACTSTDFMNNAYVGRIDNENRLTVMFKNEDGTYRPQFDTDCPAAQYGEYRKSTGGCSISANRITEVESFYEHKNHKPHMKIHKKNIQSTIVGTEQIHEYEL